MRDNSIFMPSLDLRVFCVEPVQGPQGASVQPRVQNVADLFMVRTQQQWLVPLDSSQILCVGTVYPTQEREYRVSEVQAGKLVLKQQSCTLDTSLTNLVFLAPAMQVVVNFVRTEASSEDFSRFAPRPRRHRQPLPGSTVILLKLVLLPERRRNDCCCGLAPAWNTLCALFFKIGSGRRRRLGHRARHRGWAISPVPPHTRTPHTQAPVCSALPGPRCELGIVAWNNGPLQSCRVSSAARHAPRGIRLCTAHGPGAAEAAEAQGRTAGRPPPSLV